MGRHVCCWVRSAAQMYLPSDSSSCDRDTWAHDHGLSRSTLVGIQAAWADEVSVTEAELFEAPRWRRPPSRRSARQLTTLRPAHVSIQRGDARLRKERSEWANPLKITNTCSRQDCIRSFKEHMRKQLELLARQPKLREKILVCHCDDNQALHADVLRS